MSKNDCTSQFDYSPLQFRHLAQTLVREVRDFHPIIRSDVESWADSVEHEVGTSAGNIDFVASKRIPHSDEYVTFVIEAKLQPHLSVKSVRRTILAYRSALIRERDLDPSCVKMFLVVPHWYQENLADYQEFDIEISSVVVPDSALFPLALKKLRSWARLTDDMCTAKEVVDLADEYIANMVLCGREFGQSIYATTGRILNDLDLYFGLPRSVALPRVQSIILQWMQDIKQLGLEDGRD